MVMQLAGEKRHESQDNGEVLTTKIVPTALTTSSGEEIWFEFRRQCFIFSEQLNKFCKLDYPSKEAFVVYSRSTGYGSEAKSQAALEKWGRNV
jgi:cation-transporting ATPase 13A1